MIRTLLSLAAGIGVGVAVTFAADHDHHKAVKVTQLSQRDIIEKLDGKAASATVVEVTSSPAKRIHRTTIPARCSATSWRANTSTPSTTSRSRNTRPGIRSTSRRDLCTGWPGIRARGRRRAPSR